MLTICTACGTQFRVNTAQLRAVHGLVRCSRCRSVFDAFETLQEEHTVLVPPAPPADELGALAAELSHEERNAVPPIPAGLAAHPAGGADNDLHLSATESKPALDDLFAEVWGEDTAGASTPPPDPVPVGRSEPLLIEDHIPKPAELELDQSLYRHQDLPPRERDATDSKPRRFKFRFWGSGAILLALVLAAQIVNANRLTLGHATVIGPAISGLYAAFGHALTLPPLAPSTWQISNTNVTSDPDTPGALSITGTLANRAGFAQSWPVLRIELTDRDGNPLRARDFNAGEYLPAERVATWLGPGMAAQFRIDVVDPGANAVGFTVLACTGTQAARNCGNANDGNT